MFFKELTTDFVLEMPRVCVRQCRYKTAPTDPTTTNPKTSRSKDRRCPLAYQTKCVQVNVLAWPCVTTYVKSPHVDNVSGFFVVFFYFNLNHFCLFIVCNCFYCVVLCLPMFRRSETLPPPRLCSLNMELM